MHAASVSAAADRRGYDWPPQFLGRALRNAVIFAGEAVDLVDSVLPASDIVRRICG